MEWRSVVLSEESMFCLSAIDGRVLSVDMLPWPMRSPGLFPIDIIGLQLQHYPQIALIVPVLTQQVQQASNSLP
ncbi:hypothetical protein TNCV_3014801 [Trichonephila clavipes]|nr:hypothetical protein TNCV_3014801 [Trichonephila clavipes]